MKKIFLFFLGSVALLSCSKKVAAPPLVGAVEVTEKKEIKFPIEATAEALSAPIDLGGGIIIKLSKTDFVGAVTFFNEGITITPLSTISKEIRPDRGNILVDAKIEGGNIIHVNPKAGWVITEAVYLSEKDLYPSKLKMTLEVDQGESFCMVFVVDKSTSPMRYRPEINANAGRPVINPNVGYEITDCAGNKVYITEADIPLQKLSIRLELDDTRTEKKTGGVKLPMDY